MMIMMVSSIILGPFGHYFVPLMIGSRRMAFPRLEALSFWLLPLAGVMLMTHHRLRRLPDRLDRLPDARRPGRRRAWTGTCSPSRWSAIGMILNALNMMVTVVQPPRAGHDVVAPADLRLEHADDLGADAARAADAARGGADGGARPHRPARRSSRRPAAAARSCGRTCSGSSATPRCTSSPCPGFGIVLEILPVFARKPLWGYRLAVAGMLGVTLLSFMVWQHHLFVSGINVEPAARSTCSRPS